MIIAPPLDPAAEETKTEDVRAEKQCIARFRMSKSIGSFCIARTYASLSREFGLIIRLDVEEANEEASSLTARFMCWTDKASGDLVSALAVGHKGPKLPA
jgi:hypothetical protein